MNWAQLRKQLHGSKGYQPTGRAIRCRKGSANQKDHTLKIKKKKNMGMEPIQWVLSINDVENVMKKPMCFGGWFV